MIMRSGARLTVLVLACQVWTARSFSNAALLQLRGDRSALQLATRNSARLTRKIGHKSPRMIFPGESSKEDAKDAADLVGFWQLINSTPDEESGIERLVFRADNQIGGSPRFPEWEGAQVSWAGAQMSAGGTWKEYMGPNENKRVEFCLLAPLKGAFERASGERQAMFYDGVVLEMREPDIKKKGQTTTTLRILGNMTSGAVGSDEKERRFRGKFSMIKMDTSTTELVLSVQPFQRPFDTVAREVEEEERERDHDPAGMHKRVREEAEQMQRIQERREEEEARDAKFDASMEGWDIPSNENTGSSNAPSSSGGGSSKHREQESVGDALAAELSKEVQCQTRVEREMELLREIMKSEPEQPDDS